MRVVAARYVGCTPVREIEMLPIEAMNLYREVGQHIRNHHALDAPEIVVELGNEKEPQIDKLADVPALVEKMSRHQRVDVSGVRVRVRVGVLVTVGVCVGDPVRVPVRVTLGVEVCVGVSEGVGSVVAVGVCAGVGLSLGVVVGPGGVRESSVLMSEIGSAENKTSTETTFPRGIFSGTSTIREGSATSGEVPSPFVP